jgi:hypothetical protein
MSMTPAGPAIAVSPLLALRRRRRRVRAAAGPGPPPVRPAGAGLFLVKSPRGGPLARGPTPAPRRCPRPALLFLATPKKNNITFRGRGGARRAVPRTENPLQVDRRRGSGAGSFKKQKKGTRHKSLSGWGPPPTVFFLKTFENSTQKNIKRTIKFVDFVQKNSVGDDGVCSWSMRKKL